MHLFFLFSFDIFFVEPKKCSSSLQLLSLQILIFYRNFTTPLPTLALIQHAHLHARIHHIPIRPFRHGPPDLLHFCQSSAWIQGDQTRDTGQSGHRWTAFGHSGFFRPLTGLVPDSDSNAHRLSVDFYQLRP